MPDNVCNPVHVTGDVTFKATAAVTGKRFVAPSNTRTGGGLGGLSTDLENAYRCAHAAANGPAVGIAKYDVPINGEGGFYGTPGGIYPVTCDGAVTAGDRIIVGSAGKAKTSTGSIDTSGAAITPPTVVGIAMSSAADGADAEIKLR